MAAVTYKHLLHEKKGKIRKSNKNTQKKRKKVITNNCLHHGWLFWAGAALTVGFPLPDKTAKLFLKMNGGRL